MSGSINLGRVRPKYVGAYDPDRSYDVLERVKYKGQIYECAVKTTAGIAPDSAEHGSVYWSQISVNNPVPQAVWDGTALSFEYPDGEVTTPVDLQGPQGIQGEPGEVNITSDLTSTATDVALSALAGKNLKAMIDNSGMGGVTLYDGPIDFTDEEQIEEITENKPIGSIVAYDCCNDCSTAEDVIVGGNYNTKEYITESGDYTVPVTGWCEVTCIGGGSGSFYDMASQTIQGGESGFINSAYVYLDAGTIIPVTIGAGGIGHNSNSDYASGELRGGGVTYFGEHVNSLPIVTSFMQQPTRMQDFKNTFTYLAYGGGYTSKSGTMNGIGYGSGGSVVYTNNNPDGPLVGNGAPGCVILQYYDAAKDKNISVDMASSVTLQELQNQIAALTARVQELENE